MDYQQLLKPFEESKLSVAESKLSLWNTHWKQNPGINSYDLKFHERTKRKSILHCSCRNGWTDLSIKLIKVFGLDPNFKDDKGNTSLHTACMSDSDKLVKHLVTKCDPCKTNRLGHTVLDVAIIAKKGSVVNCLVNKCGCDQLCRTNGEKIMKLLFNNWNEEVAKCLICDGGCQVTMENGTTLLHELVAKGLIEKFVFLIAKCNCSLNLLDKNGNTILHVFCRSMKSHKSITKKPFKDYDTYEEYDSYEEYHTLEQLILKYKCDPNIVNNNNMTVLHIICYSMLEKGYTFAKYRTLFFFLRDCKMSPHIKLNNTDETVLHIVCRAICHGYHDPSILYSLIVEQKCDPSKPDHDGHTAIDMAIKAKNASLVRYLIIMCGCGRLCKINGRKIMKLLFDNWNEEVAKCLICDGGCQVEMENGTTLLHELVAEGLIERAMFLVMKCNCDPNLDDKNGNTILHVFCQSMKPQNAFTKEQYHALEQLISKCKCDPKIENKKRETVLHFVCYSLLLNGYNEDRCRVLFYLLRDCKVSPHIKLNNTNDESLLHIVCKAICNGHHDPSILHSLIVKHGCEPSKANRLGHSVLDVAIIAKSDSVVNCLVNKCGCYQLCKTNGKKIMKLLLDNWNEEVAKCLICDGGCQVTMENGTTLLHELVAKELMERVVFLIVMCMCTCIQINDNGHTILDVAIIYKKGSVVNCLVNKCGCDQLCKTMGKKIMKLLFDNWSEEVAKCLICDGGCQVTMENGTTLLHELVAKGLIEKVVFLVAKCNCKPDLLDTNGNTILHVFFQSMKPHNAFTQKQYDDLEQLIHKCKCDPRIENINGETILHFVCYSLLSNDYNANRRRVLFFLLRDCKVSPHIKLNNTDESVLHIVCKAICKGYHDPSILHSLFVKHKCDPCKANLLGHTVLDVAIIAKRGSVVNCLVNKCGCDKLCKTNGKKIMKLLFDNWNEEVAKCLICDGGCQVEMENGTTLLHELVARQFIERVVFLVVKCNCNPNLVDKNGNTILHVSFYQSMKPQNSFSQKQYHSYEEYHALEKLIRECKCDPNIQDKNGETVLHFVCYSLLPNRYNEDRCRMFFFFLHDCKMSPHIKLNNTDDESVLHIVCKAICNGYHDPSILHSLIVKHGCDPSKANLLGHSVLDVAIIAKSDSVVNYLVNKCGCDQLCKTNGEKIMKLLFDNWDDEVAKCLICDGGCQVTMENGTTLLHKLVAKGLTEKVVFIVTGCNCNPNVLDNNGNTILHVFYQSMKPQNAFMHQKHHHALEQLILECKCDPNIENKNGETILHYVCYSLLSNDYNEDRCRVLFYLLRDCKVSPHIRLKNTDDKSVLHIVCKAICNGYHNPSILHSLILDHNCDPHVDKDIVLCALLQSVITWGVSSIEILCHLLVKLRIDPHIILDNGKSVCLMCYPIGDKYFNKHASLTGNTVLCAVCKSTHSSYSLTFSGLDNGHSFLMAICNRVSKPFTSSEHFEDDAALKLLCHFIAFIEPRCKCDFYKTLKEYEKLINSICSYCLSCSGLDDSKCYLTALDCLIIECDCMNFLNDGFIAKLLNACDEPYIEMQHYLIKKDSFRMAKCIFLNNLQYSKGIKDLFQFVVEQNELDLTQSDNSGDTILHYACRSFHGDTTLIAYIISTGKADPLCYNKSNETPMMLLAKSSRSVNAEEKVRQMIHQFREVKVTHLIESYVKVVVLGNAGVGKSTLIKAMCERSNYHYVFDYIFEIINWHGNVTGVDLLTAGIIPHILNDTDLGRIILHDLAGQPEYYTSHTAVLENLLESSAAVFILAVSLADENLQESFQFWLTVIENVCDKSLQQCYTFVVASHADKFKSVDTRDKIVEKLKRFSELSPEVKIEKIIPLDCRKLGGSQLSLLISSLSKSCKSISENNNKNMSIYCHLLYDFFQRDKKPVYLLESLLEIFIEQSDLFLPTKIDSLLDIIFSLQTTGLILYLRNKNNPPKSWIVVDKAILLSDLDGTLFAPEYFKNHAGIASNTGIIKVSDLSALFPKYDSELLVQFLQYMELCQIISEEFIISMDLKSLSNDSSDNDQFIFVPALIKDTKSPEIKESFTFGWCLHCTNPHHFFLSRFLHLILLHLACKFSVPQSADSKFKRLCKVWTTGIYWKDTKGVQTLVELVDNNQSLVLLMTCEETANNEMIKLIKDVILEISTCKQQIMSKTKCDEFVIDCKQLQYPVQTESLNSHLYNIEQLARCYIDKDYSGYILNNAGGQDSIHPSELLEGASLNSFCEAVFVGRKPENINAGDLNLPLKAKKRKAKKRKATDVQQQIQSTSELSSTQTVLDGSDSTMSRESREMFEHTPNSEKKREDDTKEESELNNGKDKFTPLTALSQQLKEQDFTHISSKNTHKSAYAILQEHTPEILGLLSDPDKLSVELWAKNLLSVGVKEKVRTTVGIDRFGKANLIMDEIFRFIKNDSSKDIFIQFCDVLKKHGQPGLKELAEKMISLCGCN